MKKINIPRIIWVNSIFLILIIVLISIMNYKINYQYLSYEYLYFYECDDNLCVSQVDNDSKVVYSKYECGYTSCPSFVKSLEDNYVVLKKDSNYILYDYMNSKIVCDNYQDYELINNNYIIVTLKNKKGIIDSDNQLIVDVVYDEIGYEREYLTGYNLNNIIVKQDGLYGVVSYKDGSIIEEIKYKEEEINTLLDIIKKQ